MTKWLCAALVLLASGPTQKQASDAHIATTVPADIRTLETVKTAADRLMGKKRRRPDLGIRFGGPEKGGVTIQKVVQRGPAAKAGFLPGDILRAIGRVQTRELEDIERASAYLEIGRGVKLSVLRPGLRREVLVEYRAGEKLGDPGFTFKRTRGVFLVTKVRRRGPAFRGGLRTGDTFSRVNGRRPGSSGDLRRLIKRRKRFTIRVERKKEKLAKTVAPWPAPEEKVIDWKGKTFKLGVLLVEFKDVKHNPEYGAADFERMLFSAGEYDRAPDGRRTYGSLRDYYREISVDQFDVEGKVLDWVAVPETWAYYDAQGMGRGDDSRSTVFQDALAALRKRDGSKALGGFDGVVFLYAGERRSLRGSQLWPHRSSVRIGGKGVPYYIVEEGGEEFASIGVHCHEFGHMLGLPDFYGYGHRTGVGKFCTMAIGHKGGGESGADRPFHFCAFCKIRLGWLVPKVLHPRDRQHVALRPVEGSTTEGLKILLSPSGDEYFLLEVRNRRGFDTDFFRDGLVIWHVGEDGQRPKGQISVAIDLEEAHGKRYFDASLRDESQILFPNARTDALTPDTFPSSQSNLASAHRVDLCDMRVYRPRKESTTDDLPAGTVFFRVGDRQRAALVKASEPEQPVYPRDEPVMEVDPVTELPVPFTIGEGNVAEPGPNIIPRPAKPKPKDDDGKKR